jgi:hypothetical protein
MALLQSVYCVRCLPGLFRASVLGYSSRSITCIILYCANSVVKFYRSSDAEKPVRRICHIVFSPFASLLDLNLLYLLVIVQSTRGDSYTLDSCTLEKSYNSGWIHPNTTHPITIHPNTLTLGYLSRLTFLLYLHTTTTCVSSSTVAKLAATQSK